LAPIARSGLVDLSRSPGAVAAYLRHGCIPAPATIYAEAHKLAPGHLLVVGPSGSPHIESYWDAAAVARGGQADLFPDGDPQVQAETERLLEQAVADRLVSDVPLGGWLSGGIDSSCVVALMQAASASPVRTFSIGFPAFGYDESGDAAAIARHLGTDHTELTVTAQETIDVVTQMPDVYGEPFADSSQIPTFVLSRLTREHVTVALSGDGGDEVFAGYNRYLALPGIVARAGRWPGPLRRGAASALRFLSPTAWDGLARALPARTPPQFGDKIWKVADAIAAPDLETAYLRAISFWPTDRPAAMRSAAETGNIRFDAALQDPAARLQLADTQTYLPDDILTKVDRASMAHALEVRVPLLDHRVVEHAWRLPRADLLAGNRTKQPLRRLLEKHVPRDLFARPKSGFAVPVGDWLRGPLRDWAEDLLSEPALSNSGMLATRPVRDAWADHLSGRRNLQNALWAVLMFQLWDRRART
ncbi:MAG: asparagine synthetase B, partial [Alphaproteobacteria bacterium]|nr:asparagine synthetase B [Alphaproteobacteria bacterium]